jgi:hypothetical protein
MADRAEGILMSLSLQFEGDATKLNDALNFNTINAAIAEIEDIKATVKAYSNTAHRTRTKGGRCGMNIMKSPIFAMG